MQAHDQDLGGEPSVDRAAEKRMRALIRVEALARQEPDRECDEGEGADRDDEPASAPRLAGCRLGSTRRNETAIRRPNQWRKVAAVSEA
jgi:hypothetical protein